MQANNIQTINIAILGAAKISERVLLKPAAGLEYINIAGVAARDYGRAGEYARLMGIPGVFEDYNALLHSPGIDAVYIPLNNNSHFEWICKAAAAKKHILVEKPACVTSAELAEALQVVAKNGVYFQEALMIANHPWREAIDEIVSNNSYGRLIGIETTLTTVFKDVENYRYKDVIGGGCFFDYSPYWADITLRAIDSGVKKIEIEEASYYPTGIDTDSQILIHFENGCTSRLTTSFNKPFKAEVVFRFEDAVLTIRNFFACAFGTNRIIIKVEGSSRESNLKDRLKFEAANYYVNQLRAFHNGISAGVQKEHSVLLKRTALIEQVSRLLKDNYCARAALSSTGPEEENG